MSRQCCLHAKVSRLAIAHLANHHYVWILAQDTAQAISKRQTNVVINLDLIDAVHFILNRILKRHNVNRVSFDFFNQRV